MWLIRAARALEDHWFDLTRSVRTSGETQLEGLQLAGERRDAFWYLPVRATAARSLLRALPVDDYRNYRFVDLGSGAGRMLFLAAEFPFRQIEGVELALELHRRAEQNIARFRSFGKRCHNLRSIHLSAADYEFPAENLVVAFFNSFGEQTLSDVVKRLEESVKAHPRSVIVAMIYPQFGYVMDRSNEFRVYRATAKWRIYCSKREARA